MYSVFLSRVHQLQEKCRQDERSFIIEDPIDLFYFTGLDLSRGVLIISSHDARLFVDGRYIQAATVKSPVPAALLDEKIYSKTAKNMVFDSKKTAYDRFLQLQKIFGNVRPERGFVDSIRAVKGKEELVAMRKSSAVLKSGFAHLQQSLKTGMTEKDAAWAFEKHCREHGASGMAFEPIIAFGTNSSMPHYRAGEKKLEKNDMVLIDIGVVVDHYHSDMTRVLFRGTGYEEMKDCYALVQKASNAAMSLCKPGVSACTLDKAARAVLRQAGKEEYFTHSLGHGIGLETHEFPRIKQDGEDKDAIISSGMVFTIEPGIYLPGKGGVRFETTVIMHDDRIEDLYQEV